MVPDDIVNACNNVTCKCHGLISLPNVFVQSVYVHLYQYRSINVYVNNSAGSIKTTENLAMITHECVNMYVIFCY